MRVLIACEESQVVCKAFRALGHEAYSCDILSCSGEHPEWHIQDDVLKHLDEGWDLMIAHPPCTYLSKAGACRMFPTAGIVDKKRLEKAMEAKKFFLKLLNANIPLIAVENPFPLKIIDLPKPSQTIQPYQFGHPFSKKTLLWLKGLPYLKPTQIITDFKPYLPSNTGGGKRGQKFVIKGVVRNPKLSSKTFEGIAKAMAEQWGNIHEVKSAIPPEDKSSGILAPILWTWFLVKQLFFIGLLYVGLKMLNRPVLVDYMLLYPWYWMLAPFVVIGVLVVAILLLYRYFPICWGP